MNKGILVALVMAAIVIGEWIGGPTTPLRNPLARRAFRAFSRLWAAMIFRVLSGNWRNSRCTLVPTGLAAFFRVDEVRGAMIIAGAVPMAIGLLTMSVHINVIDWMSDKEKSEWRSSLGWGGPITAAR